MSPKGPHFIVQLKPTTKAHISGRMACIDISDVATAPVYSEKTHLKKLMMMIIREWVALSM